MVTIRVERQRGFYGAFRSLRLVLDGERIGSIKQGECLVFDLPRIGRQIWGRMDWAETRRLSLDDYKPDETIVFKAYLTFNFLKTLGVSTMPFDVFIR